MTEEKAKYGNEEREDNAYQIRDEAIPRDFYTQIPNLVDVMELSPFTYRLYGHLRKVAGESGKCWQSTKTLSQSCDMSMGQVSKSKEELENVYPPLIRIESKKFDRGMYHEIAITDIWQMNHDFWNGSVLIIKTAKGQAFHTVNEWRSYSENLRSPGETKNNPIEEKPKDSHLPKENEINGIDWKIAHGKKVTKEDLRSNKDDEVENLLSQLDREFHTSFARTPKSQSVARFILGQIKKGESLDRFMAWAKRDDFNASRLYEYAEQPDKIRTRWAQAFHKPQERKSEYEAI